MVTYAPGQSGQASLTRHARGPRYASRGQALIMALLVMFLLVGLGGLFIAMISHAMVQTTRAEERDKLEDIVLAGLRLAQNELLHSAEGADWRPGPGPDQANPGWVYHAGGFFKIDVKYGAKDAITAALPFQNNPLDRFVKVDVEARYALANPPDFEAVDPDDMLYESYRKGYLSSKRFITRKVTALMPVGLTDNLLWITNLDGSPTPVTLGSTLEFTAEKTVTKGAFATGTSDADLNVLDNAASFTSSYLPIYFGPIRCDTDAEVGNMAVYLLNGNATGDKQQYQTDFHVAREDQFIVTGKLSTLPGMENVINRVLAKHDESLVAPNNLVTATAPKSVQTLERNPLLRKIEAPRLDQRNRTTGLDRYRALTRDAYGEGIYINNPDDIQYGADMDKLRAEWLNLDPENAPQPHWKNGAYYPQRPVLSDDGSTSFPGAVEVILHDWGIADTPVASAPPVIDPPVVVSQLPYIELRRYDGEPFLDATGQPLLEQRGTDALKGAYYYALKDYPRNGVMFSEGNLVVKAAMPDNGNEASGGLPASLAFEEKIPGTKKYTAICDAQKKQLPGGAIIDSTNPNDLKVKEIQYYVNEANRRFDLTIVSGGTIYIEGNLLGPASRSVGSTNPIISGDEKDSKLALLAMDNVCLNPTSLVEVVGQQPEPLGPEQVWRVKHDRSLKMLFNIAGSGANTRFLFRDAGEAQLATSNNFAAMQLLVNNTPFNWLAAFDPDITPDASKFFFSTPDYKAANLGFVPQLQWSSSMFPLLSTRIAQRAVKAQGVQGNGAQNVLEFMLDTESGSDYLMSANSGFAVTGGDIQVDALIYAQRGSWFVIPGKYFNEDDTSNDAWPLPKYHEPLDIRIVVNGAIVENRPAPLTAQTEWLKRWRGSNISYYTDAKDSTTPFLLDPARAEAGWDATTWRWTNRRMGIEYHYDATLARPVCYTKDTDGYLNYLPRLPKLPVSPTVFSFGALRGV